jgi:hypothetical protein
MVNGKLFHLPSLSFPKQRNFIGPHIWVLLSVDAFKPGPFGSQGIETICFDVHGESFDFPQ